MQHKSQPTGFTMPNRAQQPQQRKVKRSHSTSTKKPLIKKGLLRDFPWLKLFEWFCWGLLGIVAAVILSLSCEPWLYAAGYLVGPDSGLPFVSWLAKVPFIGGVASNALSVPAQFVGIVLFLFFNTVQVILFLATSNQMVMSSDKAKRVMTLSIIGYVVELYVAVLSHPPYQGGMGALMADFPNIDPYYIQYGELLAIALLLFAFEVFIWMGVVLIFAVRESQKKRRARA